MRINKAAVPIAALAIALGSFPAEAAQRGERRNRGGQGQGQERSRGDASARQSGSQGDRGRSSAGRDAQRGERSESSNRESQSQDRERQRASAPTRQRDSQLNRDRGSVDRSGQRSPDVAQRNSRDYSRDSRNDGRSRGPSTNRDYDRGRSVNRRGNYGGSNYGSYSRNYYAPRLLPRRSTPRRYYRSGGHLSLYFGLGSGYRYGSPYSGRVYGYRGRVPVYGVRQYYGDVRLKVNPRDAAVYVDGYYAGIVDDFDGFFQRLTLEVGPHQIEIDAPGLESQVFDVYVDPTRTIDLHADLLR